MISLKIKGTHEDSESQIIDLDRVIHVRLRFGTEVHIRLEEGALANIRYKKVEEAEKAFADICEVLKKVFKYNFEIN